MLRCLPQADLPVGRRSNSRFIHLPFGRLATCIALQSANRNVDRLLPKSGGAKLPNMMQCFQVPVMRYLVPRHVPVNTRRRTYNSSQNKPLHPQAAEQLNLPLKPQKSLLKDPRLLHRRLASLMGFLVADILFAGRGPCNAGGFRRAIFSPGERGGRRTVTSSPCESQLRIASQTL